MNTNRHEEKLQLDEEVAEFDLKMEEFEWFDESVPVSNTGS